MSVAVRAASFGCAAEVQLTAIPAAGRHRPPSRRERCAPTAVAGPRPPAGRQRGARPRSRPGRRVCPASLLHYSIPTIRPPYPVS